LLKTMMNENDNPEASNLLAFFRIVPDS